MENFKTKLKKIAKEVEEKKKIQKKEIQNLKMNKKNQKKKSIKFGRKNLKIMRILLVV